MQMTLNQMQRIDDLVAKCSRDLEQALPSLQLLTEASEKLVNAFERRVFDPGLLDYLIQIGTGFRRGDENTRKCCGTFLLAFNNLLSGLVDRNRNQLSIDIRYLIFETLKKCFENDDFLAMQSNLVWPDELEKINQQLDSLNTVSFNKVKDFYKTYGREITKFRIAGRFNDNQLLQKIINLSRTENSLHFKKANKVLAYLVEEHDIVPDHLGIFGLADDLQVLHDFKLEFEEKNQSTKLLSHFLELNDNPLSLFFERQEKDTDFKALTANTPQMNFILGELMYLYENNHKRVLALLPDQGLWGLLLILNIVTVKAKQLPGLNELPRPGEKIYFNLPRNSIEIEFLGECPENENKVWVQGVGSHRDIKLLLPRSSVDLATKKPRKKVDKKANQARLISQWQTSSHTFIPSHLSFSALDRSIYYLTRKNKFEESRTHLKPFGANLSEFINFRYRGEDNHKDDPVASRLPKVDVYSSADQLREQLEEKDKNCIVVSDDPHLANNFLSDLSDGLGDQNIQMFFLSSIEERALNNNASGRDFAEVYFPSQIRDLPNIEHKINYDDPISSLEKKVFMVSKPIAKHYIEISSLFFEKFNQILMELFKVRQEDDNYVPQGLLWKLHRYKSYFFKKWYPLSSADTEKGLSLITETISELDILQDDNVHFKNLLQLIAEKRDTIFDFHEERKVISFLRDNLETNFVILEENMNRKIEASKFLERKTIFNAEVRTFSEIKGTFFEDKELIIPYQMDPKTLRYLSHKNTAKKVNLFLFDSEKKDFQTNGSRVKSFENALINKTAKVFKNSALKSIFDKMQVVQEDKVSAPAKVYSDYENEFISSFIPKARSANQLELVDAIPFLLDENSKILFLTPRSSVVLMQEENQEMQFSLRSTGDIVEGDFICLPANSKSDMFEQLARKFAPDYDQIKFQATSWKRELNRMLNEEFSDDMVNFSKFLQEHEIKRTIPTIRNWLIGDITIAPQNPMHTLKKLSNISSDSFKGNLENTLSSIDKCYSLRREHSEELIRVLNNRGNVFFSDQKIEVTFQDVTLDYVVHEVSMVNEKQKIEFERLWQPDDVK